MRRLSTFPLDNPFERLEPSTPFSELVLRLVVDAFSDSPEVVGTATVLCGHLLVTAKHVLEKVCNVDRSRSESKATVNRSLSAVQVLGGPNYVIWAVTESILQDSSDIALLRLGTNPATTELDEPHQWKQPIVNPFAPDLGERVAAFGYRRSRIVTSPNSQGGHHIDLNDEMMASVGIVRERFELRRDRRMLPFPCYRVSSRFDAGMSGGPVFDEFGSLCGIVCSSFDGPESEDEPISYVATLWPLFDLGIDFDRGDRYPRGVQYPAIELARGGQIKVSDLPRLENWFSSLQQSPGP